MATIQTVSPTHARSSVCGGAIDMEPQPLAPMEIDVSPSCASISLVELPVEILLCVGQWLAPVSTRALLAWASVTGVAVPDRLLCASVDAWVERAAVSLLTQPVRHNDSRLEAARVRVRREIIRAGAPLAVAVHLLPRDLLPHKAMVEIAIGGRVDVLEWAWQCIGVDRKAWYGDERCDSTRCAADAMVGAAQRDRRAALCWLLDRAKEDCVHPFTTFAREKVILYGLERGHADVVDVLHRLQRKAAYLKKCWCPSYLKKRILREGRSDMLALLHDADCDIMCGLNASDLDKTVRKGHEAAARWIAAHLKEPKISGGAIRTAAIRGHLQTVAFAHDSGLGTCAPSHVAYAMCNGHLHIAKWACGDDPRLAPLRPVAQEYGPHLAYQVVARGHVDVLAWMTQRRDIVPTIGVGVARFAVASGHWRCALVLHDCGLVPLHAWDALVTAVRHCAVDGITALADAGARCDAAVMAAALSLPKPDALRFLCARFGIRDLQGAIDAVTGLAFVHSTMAWVASNVPDVCVAQPSHQQWANSSVPQCRHFSCACARCRAG
ncbi:hypothetical protein pneo_cds_817 [Pandoravirus neocaledonia]|uniref:Ankyrin repeat domain containing protein n=1 Tax=Pandoravirus neocaledonia TaxID=2107708 RepID=A0A2U7UDA5_9VIRU|nr:hypothetical protein pneo_cds_817 [Pandoravirus neocaledonia]AVK76424.1 hypothetical protein pneo_cds_817 [Pandoravirus neocaledonia]